LRQIGLGIMGLADAFIKLGIEYGSDESINLINQIGRTLINEALRESAILAEKYGPFPAYKAEYVLQSPFLRHNADRDVYDLIKKNGLRNSQLLTIAPTGSIATLLGCSNGVEPLFQISYTRKTESILGHDKYYKVYSEIVREYMNANNLSAEEELPEFIITADKLDYKKRIDVQSAFQQFIDASISSTVNVPNEFTVEEVEDLYMYAWKKQVKGITIYRDGCDRAGILTTENTKKNRIQELQDELNREVAKELEENPGVCPMCGGKMNNTGGCKECQDCGYSPCAI
jgi:ribonucleoside-diphosphate reductase alpha chain